MADDIIGTPVERVIPEGWHVLRNGDVANGDACTGDYWWNAVGPGMTGKATDCNGFCFDNGVHLVIRRNAQEKPEPSVESWKAKVAELETALDAERASYSAKDAEVDRLKAEAEQLKRDLKASDARYCQQFQDVGRMCDKLNAIRKVMEGA